MNNVLLSKAINAVKLGTKGELSETDFNAVATCSEFINALHAKEEAFQKNITTSSVVEAVVLESRLSDERLLRNYYLHFVKHPLLLTDREWFEIDPKGDADLLRDIHFALWNFDSDDTHITKQQMIELVRMGYDYGIKEFYQKRLKKSHVFRKLLHSIIVISDPAKKEYCVRLIIENPHAKLPRGCGKSLFSNEVFYGN